MSDITSCETCKCRKDIFVPCDWLRQRETVLMPSCPRYEEDKKE